MNTQIERVARAFYDALYGEGNWEYEFEELKDQFRDDAAAAIALLDGSGHDHCRMQAGRAVQDVAAARPLSYVHGAA